MSSSFGDASKQTVDVIVDNFEAACEEGRDPDIADYLSDEKPNRRAVLVELVHIELERKLKSGENLRIEHYLARFPELADSDDVLLDLIGAEWRLRSRLRDRVAIGDYADRFPKLKDRLSELTGTESELTSRSTLQLISESVLLRCPHCGDRVDAPLTTEDVRCAGCGGSFQVTPGRHPAKSDRCDLPDLPGFELLNEVGRGAFGTVYRARDRKLDRIVAVKVPRRASFSSTEEEDRFLREAKSAARLKHPGIVPVHEVGEWDGLPYIVSEFITGLPLSMAIGEHGYGVRESAELCRKIAQALQHAHDAGVVHRDLKPSNVMLDTKGEPHVMDFGLAKRDASDVTMTMEGQVLGTPAYMSPEQARGEAYRADGRTDVYSLGVILFELLTGERPFRGNMRMLLQQVLHDQPSGPRRFNNAIPADLETICLKCLEKEPQQRYSSARDLEADLSRFLEGRPISARPVSRVEQFRRWCVRNRSLAGVGGVALLLLLVLAVGGPLAALRQTELADEAREAAAAERTAKLDAQQKKAQAERAAEAEKSAKQQAEKRLKQIERGNEILTAIFADLNIDKPGGEPLKAALAKRLINAAKQLEGESVGEPLTVAKMQIRLGISLLNLGYPKEATSLLEKARAAVSTKLGTDHSETLKSMHYLAGAYQALGHLKRALPLLEKTLKLRTAKLGPDDPETLASMHNLASAYLAARDLKRALPLFEKSLKLTAARFGLADVHTLIAMNNLASAYHVSGDLKRALPLFEKTLKLSTANLGPEHYQTLIVMNDLAAAYQAAGDLKRSLPMKEKVLQLMTAKFGSEHPFTLTALFNLSDAYRVAGDLKRAVPLYEKTLTLTTAKLGLEHEETLKVMNNLAVAYLGAGDVKRALPLFEKALTLKTAKLGPEHPETLAGLRNLAVAYCKAKRANQAANIYEKYISALRKQSKPVDTHFSDRLFDIGLDLLNCGQYSYAEKYLRECLTIRETTHPNHSNTYLLQILVGVALRRQKKYASAEPMMLKGYRRLKQVSKARADEVTPLLTSALRNLVQLYNEWNKPEEAAKWRKELQKLLSAVRAKKS